MDLRIKSEDDRKQMLLTRPSKLLNSSHPSIIPIRSFVTPAKAGAQSSDSNTVKAQRAFTLIEPDSLIQSRRDNNKSAPMKIGVYMNAVKAVKAFTLIELLIVITILAILGSAISIVLNPAELLAEARDSQRINDLESLRNSLSLTLIDNPSLFDSLSNTSIYLSLPSSSCLTNPPSGYTYICNATSLNLQKTDSTGWLPLSLTNLPVFPIDPVNSSSSSLYYAFVPDLTNHTFVLTSLLESEKYLKLSALKDGGTDPGRIEEGNPTLWTSASGLVGYWPMDEGSGSVAGDLSGNNNTGTLTNGPTWSASSSCKVGQCLSFDFIDDYIGTEMARSSAGTSVTFSAWIYFAGNAGDTYSPIFGLHSVTTGTWNFFIGKNSGNLSLGVEDGNYTSNTGLSLIRNQWQHIVYVRSGATGRTYIDGVPSASTFSVSTPDGGKIALGWEQQGATWKWNGLIDEARVYKRAFTAKEVEAMYSSQK